MRAAIILRLKGLSHRQIAKVLKIAVGSVALFTKDVRLTRQQHLNLMKNTGLTKYPKVIRSKWSSKGSNNWLAHLKYSRDDLIKKIRDFYSEHDRIPTKREFYNNYSAFRRVFGTWNEAIAEAGYIPNPVRFTHKFKAKDGHICDSLAEMIIDNWLSSHDITHQIHVYYPNQRKLSVDFLVNNTHWIEFFGLKGELSAYDRQYANKHLYAQKTGIKIIPLLPQDIFPHNHLSSKLGFLMDSR